MRALAASVLIALALAACGNTHTAGSISHPSCQVSPTPSLPPSPAPDEEINYNLPISQGQTIKRPAAVPPQQILFAVFATWSQGHVQFSLIAPSGKVYDTNTTDPAAHHHFQPSGESFAIDRPESGDWTIQLVGDDVPSTGGHVSIQITEMPMTDFAPIAVVRGTPDRGVAPLTVDFAAQANAFQGATIVSYRWTFDDCSAASTQQNPTHVFKSAGTYAVVLSAIDSNGLADYVVEQIVVTAYNHPPTAAFAWGSLDQAHPNNVYFDAQYSNDVDGHIASYAWDFGDGITGTGVALYHAYASTGTYAVTLTVTDDGGLTATTKQLVATGGFFLPPTPSSQ